MLIPEERMLLLGDACNSNTFLFQDYSTSVEEFLESLIRLKGLVDGRFDTILSSHGDGVLDPSVIDENIALCRRILDGAVSEKTMTFHGDVGYIADSAATPPHGNIIYNPDRIRRTNPPADRR